LEIFDADKVLDGNIEPFIEAFLMGKKRQKWSMIETRYYHSSILFIAGFSVYLFTLSPEVFVGDSGELAVAGWFIVFHIPPGFRPILIHPADADFPVREHRVPVKLVFSAAGRCSTFAPFFILKELDFPNYVRVFASLLFMVVPNLWSQAVIARVYTLSHFLYFLSILLGIGAHRRNDIRCLYAAMFSFGLALNTHAGYWAVSW